MSEPEQNEINLTAGQKTAGRFSKKFKRRLKIGLVIFLFGAILFCCFTDRFVAIFLFNPMKPWPGTWEPSLPDGEAVEIETADGSILDGLYFPCENARAVVLLSHGNGQILKSIEQTAMRYRDEFQVSILIYDYRGYGRSEGHPSATGILDDGRAARKWLAEREGIDEREIVQMGFSLGGSVAIDMAAKDGARGLILQSTFTSLPDIIASKIPLVPTKSLLYEQLDSLDKIKSYDGPLFISHADADWVIPYRQGIALFEAGNGAGPKTFHTLKGREHYPPDDEEYLVTIREFIRELPPEKEFFSEPPVR